MFEEDEKLDAEQLALLGGDFDDEQNLGDADKETKSAEDAIVEESAKDNQAEDAGADADSNGNEKQESRENQKQERSPVIPRARFDEVNKSLKAEREAREALEARLEALENHPQKTDEKTSHPDVAELERQWHEALEEADTDKALEIRGLINAELKRQAREDALNDFEAKQAEKQRRDAAETAQSLLNDAAVEVAKAYPVLDVNSELSDESVIAEVVEYRDFLISVKGKPAHEALRIAAEKVVGKQPPLAPKEDPKKDTRQEKAVERGMKDSQRQPPTNEAGLGVRATGMSVALPDNQDDYDKIPDKERQRLLQ